MNIQIPAGMHRDIEFVLVAYAGRTLPIYREAETIRRRWTSANVALEDVVENMLQLAAAHQLAVELDAAQAADALLGLVAETKSL
jgi:hypothetical protein